MRTSFRRISAKSGQYSPLECTKFTSPWQQPHLVQQHKVCFALCDGFRGGRMPNTSITTRQTRQQKARRLIMTLVVEPMLVTIGGTILPDVLDD
ncbi:hypothetical protein MRB53_038834 [Persea americana]|nr:hypothetical protein MRB53_038834 [Persea americana]